MFCLSLAGQILKNDGLVKICLCALFFLVLSYPELWQAHIFQMFLWFFDDEKKRIRHLEALIVRNQKKSSSSMYFWHTECAGSFDVTPKPFCKAAKALLGFWAFPDFCFWLVRVKGSCFLSNLRQKNSYCSRWKWPTVK